MTEVASMQKVKVRGQRSRSQRSTPNLAVSGPLLQFEFTYDDEMMHRAWCCLGEVPYFSQGHLSNFKVTRLKKSSILTQIGCFWTVTPVWFHQRLQNDAQSLKQDRRDALLFLKAIHQSSRSRGTKYQQFDPNWAFPDCNPSLTSLMDLKWSTRLDVV